MAKTGMKSGGNGGKTTKTSSFLRTVGTKKGIQEKLKKAKSATDESKAPEIEPGKYHAVLAKATFTEDKPKKAGGDPIPTWKFSLVIKGSDFDGLALRKKYVLADQDYGQGQVKSADEAYEKFSKDLIRLGLQEDKDLWEKIWTVDGKLEEILNEMVKEETLLEITVRENNYSDWPIIFIDGLADTEDSEEESEDEEEGDEPFDSDSEEGEEGGEDSEEEGDAEEGDEEAEEEDEEAEEEDANAILIVKKMQVRFKPPGAKKAVVCNVLTSDPKMQTCSLMDTVSKKTHKGVKWDAVEPVTD